MFQCPRVDSCTRHVVLEALQVVSNTSLWSISDHEMGAWTGTSHKYEQYNDLGHQCSRMYVLSLVNHAVISNHLGMTYFCVLCIPGIFARICH